MHAMELSAHVMADKTSEADGQDCSISWGGTANSDSKGQGWPSAQPDASLAARHCSEIGEEVRMSWGLAAHSRSGLMW